MINRNHPVDIVIGAVVTVLLALALVAASSALFLSLCASCRGQLSTLW